MRVMQRSEMAHDRKRGGANERERRTRSRAEERESVEENEKGGWRFARARKKTGGAGGAA